MYNTIRTLSYYLSKRRREVFGIGMSLPNITWRKWSAEEVNSDDDDGETPDTSYHSVVENVESICLVDIDYRNVVRKCIVTKFSINFIKISSFQRQKKRDNFLTNF